jgi:ParB/RepB/Spo0J family partition protein
MGTGRALGAATARKVLLMSTVTSAPVVSLDLIDVGENVRELDQAHVQALASSIALRGLIAPLTVRPNGERFTLVAGYHRYAACKSLGVKEAEITLREQDGSSADSAAENVVRKQLSPLEEARAVQNMLDEGFTLDGAASALGWSLALVNSRAKILELPEIAQRLLGTHELPVSAVDTLLAIAKVSVAVCEAALAPVADGRLGGDQFTRDPGWAIGHGLRDSSVFGAYLNVVSYREIVALRLGKKTEALYAEAETLHNKLVAHAYGPPTIRFAESDLDQARAAGVLIEFEHGTPLITDRALYRELIKQAIRRTVEELQATKRASDRDSKAKRANGVQPSPRQRLDAEHRAQQRAFKAQAHGTNLDLGAALLQKLAAVAPSEMDVARFFAYGLLGRDDDALSRNDPEPPPVPPDAPPEPPPVPPDAPPEPPVGAAAGCWAGVGFDGYVGLQR